MKNVKQYNRIPPIWERVLFGTLLVLAALGFLLWAFGIFTIPMDLVGRVS